MATIKQKIAVDALMRGLPRSDAMLEAGYAGTNETRFFRNKKVVEYINEKRAVAMERNELTEDYIINRLLDISEANLGDLLVTDKGETTIDYSRMSPALRYAMSGLSSEEGKEGRGADSKSVVRLKVTTADKLRALEMLGKYLGLFATKVSVSMDDMLVSKLQEGRARANLDKGD